MLETIGVIHFTVHKDPLISIRNYISTVKHLYSGHLRFLKNVSAIRMCPLYRVLNFFEEKKDHRQKSHYIFFNSNSLQLHFLKNILKNTLIVLCLTFCNFSKTLYSIQTIKGFFLTSCSSSAISSSDSLIKAVSSDYMQYFFLSAFLSPIYVC